jgi:hypothetical protein
VAETVPRICLALSCAILGADSWSPRVPLPSFERLDFVSKELRILELCAELRAPGLLQPALARNRPFLSLNVPVSSLVKTLMIQNIVIHLKLG